MVVLTEVQRVCDLCADAGADWTKYFREEPGGKTPSRKSRGRQKQRMESKEEIYVCKYNMKI